MKLQLFVIMTLLSQISYGQTYADLMTDASRKIESKNFKEAYVSFEKAFEQKEKIGKYDYTNAAVVAIKCNKFDTALQWLRGGFELGLGTNEEELYYLKKDEIFAPLQHDPNFVILIELMEENLVMARQNDIVKDSIWRESILANRIEMAGQSTYSESQIPKGFALYELDESYSDMPYVVYFPRSLNNVESIKNIVVFLHGGVSSKKEFNPFDASIRSEPIFDVADSLNFVVIYPIGKKEFGWKNQRRAFDAIYEIVSEFTSLYNIKGKDLFLGGMSEGGTATFWFANKAESPFKGFFSISALPILPEFALANEHLCPKHSMHSIHAMDDNTYTHDSFINVYNNCKKMSNWHLTTVQNGGHGFAYQEGSIEVLLSFFKEFLRANTN